MVRRPSNAPISLTPIGPERSAAPPLALRSPSVTLAVRSCVLCAHNSRFSFFLSTYWLSLFVYRTWVLRDNISGNNFWLLRGKIQSRHTSSRIYYCYILVNSDQQGLDAVNYYYCTCKSGKRTLGSCAHIMSIIWFLSWARYETINHPAEFLDSIIVDDNDA